MLNKAYVRISTSILGSLSLIVILGRCGPLSPSIPKEGQTLSFYSNAFLDSPVTTTNPLPQTIEAARLLTEDTLLPDKVCLLTDEELTSLRDEGEVILAPRHAKVTSAITLLKIKARDEDLRNMQPIETQFRRISENLWSLSISRTSLSWKSVKPYLMQAGLIIDNGENELIHGSESR